MREAILSGILFVLPLNRRRMIEAHPMAGLMLLA
jgi:hypothetical protein